jgi:hypothetical protein
VTPPRAELEIVDVFSVSASAELHWRCALVLGERPALDTFATISPVSPLIQLNLRH